MSRSRPIVIVTRRLPAPIERTLRERYDTRINASDVALDADAIIQAVRDADALVTSVSDRVPASALESTPRRLRIIANFGVGTDRIDLDAARRSGIVVANTPGVLTEDTADLTMLLLLAAARRASEAERELRRGDWTGWRPTHMLGTRVQGKSLGIIGFGRIGRAVARRAARGFDMTIRYFSSHEHATDPNDGFVPTRADTLDELLASSDFVSLHVPASAATKHLIDRRRLSQMPPHTMLINTARGEIVDEEALCDALEARTIAGAGLDVYEREPTITARLLALPNVTLLPHIGSATVESRVAMGELVLGNLDAFFRGTTIPHRVV